MKLSGAPLVRTAIGSTWLLLSCPLAGAAGALSGVVLDPQGRVIVGASVVLVCDQDVEERETDSTGRFVLPPRDELQHCTLNVSHSDFNRFSRPVRDALEPWSIHLELESFQEEVTVPGGEPDIAVGRGLSSASLSFAEPRRVSNETEDLLRYAKALAGTTLPGDSLYVDGLPAALRPPAETIARMTVNADPFSVENSESGRNRIEVTTR